MRVKFQSRNLKGTACCGQGNGNFDCVKETRKMSLVRLRSPEERQSSVNLYKIILPTKAPFIKT